VVVLGFRPVEERRRASRGVFDPRAHFLPDDAHTQCSHPTPSRRQVTKYETLALGDVNIRKLPKGDVIQLERRGYFIVDQPWAEGAGGGRAVLLAIPDGKAKAAPVGRPVEQGPIKEAELRR
jgi:hypothetical protein